MRAVTPPVSYIVPGEQTSPRFAHAFAHGCRGRATEADSLQPGPIALFGSPRRWHLLQDAIARGRTWYYADHAYFGRGLYFRITKNAYQHDGRSDASPKRFERFGLTVRPWRTVGAHIVVCPQSDVYFSLHGLDASRWVADVSAALRRHTDRELRVRWKRDPTPIAADLQGAWAVVVFSSIAAVDALVAGVPVFVLAPFAATRRMGLDDLSRIESPIYPDDRDPFLWSLAANQWTLDEIEHGLAWRVLRGQEAPRAAA